MTKKNGTITAKLFAVLIAVLILSAYTVDPSFANSAAQAQNEFNTATAGASSGATITVDQNITGGEPYTTNNVTLEWDPSQEESVTGYLLYYGNASSKYLPPIDVGLNTNYTINDLNTKQMWFFAVKAYDGEGNQSDYSNEVFKDQLVIGESSSTASTAMSFTHDPLALNEDFGVDTPGTDDSPRTSTLPENLNSGKIVAGTGPWVGNGGWIKTLTDNYFHDHWSRLGWPHYNTLQGESRIAKGDIDGDGKDEIIIGMGPVTGDETAPAGHFQVLDDNHQHLYWGQVNWGAYNEGNGEIWPACGDLDGDGKDEILIGLGRGGMGIVEVFSVTNNQLVHVTWIASSWDEYNLARGEVRPSSGDLNGDGKDDIVLGFGQVTDNPEIPGGTYEILTNLGQHMAWGEVSWNDYNQLNGESRPVIGDLDGDGTNEIVIGLGSGANGAFEIQGFNEEGNLTNQAWLETPWWQAYNDISGETRPAVGNLDNDSADELVIALGKGGGGWLHLFDDKESGYNHYISLQLWPEEYNMNNGASWIVIQE
ncbi:FG-GAP repeat protein [bacterium]|nr:FG-GAP repeat protein [bacterium]